MNKINLLLAEANGNLANQKEVIEQSIENATKYAFPKLEINWDIDVVVSSRLDGLLIPEDGVGGYTYASDFITFAVDEEAVTEAKMTEMLVHEICHAARWGKNPEEMNILWEGIINEGIATYFEAEYAKNKPQKTFFIDYIERQSEAENRKILKLLAPQFNECEYDYPTIFYRGDDKTPRWDGYSLGYYLVSQYLQKFGEKIEDVFALNYEDFWAVLDEKTSDKKQNRRKQLI